VNVVRNLERRLERMLEGVGSKLFAGRLHPSELAGKLAREADFARFQHPTGPATANHFVIEVNPADLTVDSPRLARLLAAEMTAYTAEEGLRLEGPVTVDIRPSEESVSGRVECHVEVVPGPPVAWARLKARDESFDIGRNRAVIGRSSDADVVIPHDDISRRHALIYTEKGQAHLSDLNSANGTVVDGVRIGAAPVVMSEGSVVELGEHRYRFVGI
jgi:FHA domain/Protein of unknown function (DUF3662)